MEWEINKRSANIWFFKLFPCLVIKFRENKNVSWWGFDLCFVCLCITEMWILFSFVTIVNCLHEDKSSVSWKCVPAYLKMVFSTDGKLKQESQITVWRRCYLSVYLQHHKHLREYNTNKIGLCCSEMHINVLCHLSLSVQSVVLVFLQVF